MKIAIDGPSASGKGVISKILAKILNAEYLNTGKIYRIIAFLANKKGGNLKDEALKIAENIEKYFTQEAENTNLFTEEIAGIASKIAQIPKLREKLIEFQYSFAKKTENVIIEGRDIGTVIMPFADFKFFLDASPEERAKRRVLQLQETGKPAIYQQILTETKARDKADKERKIAGLKIAPDAYFIDTTSKTIEDVVNEMLEIIRNTPK